MLYNVSLKGACFLKSNKIAAVRNRGRTSGIRDCGTTTFAETTAAPVGGGPVQQPTPAPQKPTNPPKPGNNFKKFHYNNQKKEVFSG